MLRALHVGWSGLDFVEAACRANPEDRVGVMPHLLAAEEPEETAKKSRRQAAGAATKLNGKSGS